MRRQMLVSGVLAVVIALIMVVGTTAQAEMEQYESEVILSLPWGSGPNEIGYYRVPEGQEGRRWGPEAMGVDSDGSIYIYDTINARVKVFDQKGNLLRNFSVEATATNMCVDSQKAVWMLDNPNAKICKYDSAGTLVETVQYEPAQEKDRHWAGRIKAQGKMIYSEGHGGWFEVQPNKVPSKAIAGKRLTKAVLKLVAGKGEALTKSGYHYRKGETGRNSLIVTDKHGNTVLSVQVSKYHPDDGVGFFSEDKYNNIYLRVSGWRESKVYEEIWKYNLSNELMAKIGPIDKTWYVGVQGQWLILDQEGNVYVLDTEKEGVKIVKWSRK
ncbi:MAG: hypothetical protein V1800_13590 [Candidatus Latescibacterota bacterium]